MKCWQIQFSRFRALRFRNQGTLFALTEAESDHLWGLLLERDPSIEPHWVARTEIGQLTELRFIHRIATKTS